MTLSVHCNFNGDCRAAFESYARHLDGDIGVMLTVKDSPISADYPASWQDKIVHGNVRIGDMDIAGADVPPTQYDQPTGFYLLLGLDTKTEVRNAFEHLSVDGNVIMQPQQTFWSSCYAITVDRFGVPWKLNCRQ